MLAGGDSAANQWKKKALKHNIWCILLRNTVRTIITIAMLTFPTSYPQNIPAGPVYLVGRIPGPQGPLRARGVVNYQCNILSFQLYEADFTMFTFCTRSCLYFEEVDRQPRKDAQRIKCKIVLLNMYSQISNFATERNISKIGSSSSFSYSKFTTNTHFKLVRIIVLSTVPARRCRLRYPALGSGLPGKNSLWFAVQRRTGRWGLCGKMLTAREYVSKGMRKIVEYAEAGTSGN